MKLKFSLFCILWMTSVVWSYGQDGKAKKVLFVGNSYTYFWNLPQTVRIMSLNDSMVLDTRQSTSGGVSLRNHWNGENNLKTVEMINNNHYDVIVLQDHSLQAIQKADSLHYYGKLFADLIKKKDTKIYLYLTWARENDPSKQDKITEEYHKLAKEINATVVPVGPMWQKVIQERPDIKLFDDDGSHPSFKGTYLTACLFYKYLTGKSPEGFSPRIISKDDRGERLYLNILPEENAKYFQKTANGF